MHENNKQHLQEMEYVFPYHHIYTLDPYYKVHVTNVLTLSSAIRARFILREVLSYYLKKKKKLSILDFGCGDGRIIKEIINLEKKNKIEIEKIIGVDISKRAILFAKAFNYDYKKLVLYDKDIHSIDIKSSSVDIIISTEVFEHIPDSDLESILLKLHDLLHPEGIMILTVPTTNLPLHPKHYRHYDVSLLRKQVGSIFNLTDMRYIINKKYLKVYSYLLSNRFFSPNWDLYLKVVHNIFRSRVENADERTGITLFAIAQR